MAQSGPAATIWSQSFEGITTAKLAIKWNIMAPRWPRARPVVWCMRDGLVKISLTAPCVRPEISVGLQLKINQLINKPLVYKMSDNCTNTDLSYLKPSMMRSNAFFCCCCLTIISKPKDFQFIITWKQEKQPILIINIDQLQTQLPTEFLSAH